MKRRSIFAMLATALTAAAQQFKGEPPEPDWRQCADPKDYPLSCGKKLAKNNQCPVCGTMAEPWNMNDQYSINGHHIRANNEEVVWLPLHGENGHAARLVRCHRCNAAFWQDAEEKR